MFDNQLNKTSASKITILIKLTQAENIAQSIDKLNRYNQQYFYHKCLSYFQNIYNLSKKSYKTLPDILFSRTRCILTTLEYL